MVGLKFMSLKYFNLKCNKKISNFIDIVFRSLKGKSQI